MQKCTLLTSVPQSELADISSSWNRLVSSCDCVVVCSCFTSITISKILKRHIYTVKNLQELVTVSWIYITVNSLHFKQCNGLMAYYLSASIPPPSCSSRYSRTWWVPDISLVTPFDGNSRWRKLHISTLQFSRIYTQNSEIYTLHQHRICKYTSERCY